MPYNRIEVRAEVQRCCQDLERGYVAPHANRGRKERARIKTCEFRLPFPGPESELIFHE
jgi:hypothetical protein